MYIPEYLNNVKKTKIVCTIGPSSRTEEIIGKLFDNGLNVARLNFSHGSFEEHGENIRMLKKVAAEKGKQIAILQDLQGPKIRVGVLPKEGIKMRKGEHYVFASLEHDGEEGVIPVQYADLHKDLKVGEVVLFSDGSIAVEVTAIKGEHVHAKCIVSGVLFSKKGMNMPSSDLKISAITEQDLEHLKFGLDQKVDLVAFSFVRKGTDFAPAKKIIAQHTHKPWLIAKIEKPQAVENIDEILKEVDGIMVARGDLGVEIPLEQVPIVQKHLIDKAIRAGKFVITATQMLKSMVDSPFPSRAEMTDIANAIYDGTDAVMLSDETAAGEYPAEACEYLKKVALATETHLPYCLDKYEANTSQRDLAVIRSAISIAKSMPIKAILIYTSSGHTARLLSRFRPNMPIIALTPSQEVCTRLNMLWNVEPQLSETYTDVDALTDNGIGTIKKLGLAQKGDSIIVIAGTPLGKSGLTNFVRVEEI